MQVEAVEHIVEDAGQHNVSLDGLAICLGPDLRAMYPLVMNFGVEGELAVSGPAHPDQVRRGRAGRCRPTSQHVMQLPCGGPGSRGSCAACLPACGRRPSSGCSATPAPSQVRVRGTVRLPSGDVNLVATQLALDREHANLITFTSESGLDPLVDLVMKGGDLRVAIQVGRCRARQGLRGAARRHVVLGWRGLGAPPLARLPFQPQHSLPALPHGVAACATSTTLCRLCLLLTAGPRQRVAGPPDAALHQRPRGAPRRQRRAAGARRCCPHF